MTVRSKTVTTNYDGTVLLYRWLGLANGDSGSPIESGEWGDRAVQVVGTFGAGGTIVWEGSNDGTNYVTLKDPFDNSMSFTAAGLKTAIDAPLYCRPRVTAGDGTTDLDVYVCSRRPLQVERVVTDAPMRAL